MEVVLNKDYVVKIDNFNHTLYRYRRSNTKTGKVYDKPKQVIVGYYSNMEKALKGTLNDVVGDTEVTVTVEGYLEEVKRIWGELGGKT